MKIASIVAAVGIVVSLPVMAEPYAEWGVLKNGMSLSMFAEGIDVPEASEVPIPLAPGGRFILVTYANGSCLVVVRTKHSIADTCAFYKAALSATEYQRVKEAETEGEPSCAIFKDGDAGMGGTGVMVGENTDPVHSRNGSTLVHVRYQTMSDADCDG
jgi:hypothetical protein